MGARWSEESARGCACLIFAVLCIAAAPAETEALHQLVPCTPGLAVEHELVGKKDGTSVQITDTVRGVGKRPTWCVIDRVTVRAKDRVEKDAFLYEVLDDRILNAGWIDQPLAFAPPILKLPLELGKKWRFNTAEYEIRAIDATVEVPAGKFEHCVRVVERALDGSHEGESTYAPGVGLVLYESRDVKQRAIKVVKDVPPRTGADKREKPATSKR